MGFLMQKASDKGRCLILESEYECNSCGVKIPSSCSGVDRR